MKNSEVAVYMQQNHPKEDYLLLTLTSCSLLLNKTVEDHPDLADEHPALGLVNDTLNDLREGMEPGEVYIVGVMMDEVDRLLQTGN